MEWEGEGEESLFGLRGESLTLQEIVFTLRGVVKTMLDLATSHPLLFTRGEKTRLNQVLVALGEATTLSLDFGELEEGVRGTVQACVMVATAREPLIQRLMGIFEGFLRERLDNSVVFPLERDELHRDIEAELEYEVERSGLPSPQPEQAIRKLLNLDSEWKQLEQKAALAERETEILRESALRLGKVCSKQKDQLATLLAELEGSPEERHYSSPLPKLIGKKQSATASSTPSLREARGVSPFSTEGEHAFVQVYLLHSRESLARVTAAQFECYTRALGWRVIVQVLVDRFPPGPCLLVSERHVPGMQPISYLKLRSHNIIPGQNLVFDLTEDPTGCLGTQALEMAHRLNSMREVIN